MLTEEGPSPDADGFCRRRDKGRLLPGLATTVGTTLFAQLGSKLASEAEALQVAYLTRIRNN